MSRMATGLWFDGQADEAARFYVAAFRDCGREASLGAAAYYGDAGPGPNGSVLTVEFVLDGQDFIAVNGGPHFRFSPAISLVVKCRDQAELDRFWATLSDGGQTGRCGWLTDRFGLSWQIVPEALGGMMQDPARSDRVMGAILQMTKLDIARLEAACGERAA